MTLGPGVFVGPVFMALGVVCLIGRRPLGGQLARIWRDELAGSSRMTILGVLCIVMGGLALLAGLGWMNWWPLA